MMPPKFYLIPSPISEDNAAIIPGYITDIVGQLRYFVVEEEREGRRSLKQIAPQLPLPECVLLVVNEHTSAEEIKEIFAKIGSNDCGIVSDAGCPCVADPGADIVALAHQRNFAVLPLVGPSSILLALMASGLNGQNFAFNGYLPKERAERIRKLKFLEKRSAAEDQTQIFMDTPYRNQHVFDDIVSSCDPRTMLCVAVDLTGRSQSIKTLPVREWKTKGCLLAKQPVIFLLHQRKRN